MKITKFGHSCFLVQENGVKILFDPGNLSTAQDDETGIDLILITHDHQDHCYIPSIRAVLAKNPKAKILTNKGVGAVLGKEKIPYELLENGQTLKFKEVLIEGFGEEHAVIYPGMPIAPNTGYFIADRLFFPGDALYDPKRPVAILALPAFAPWSKIEETIDYAKKINAEASFPVHDAILARPEFVSQFVGGILRSQGVKFTPIELNKATEF